MFGRFTEQQAQENNQYTQECNKIYRGFRIAEVKKTLIKEAALPIISSVFLALMIMAFVVCVVRIKVYGDMDGDNKLIFTYLYILIAAFVLSAAVWIGFSLRVRLQGKDKTFHRYLYRDKAGLFSICVSEADGKPVITHIMNCDSLRGFDGVEKDNLDWYDHKFERESGIKQFVISPNAVFCDTNQSLIAHKHKLKKKTAKGNTVIYKFYSVQGFMIGARHPHCLVVKDGKIQYAVAHYMRKYSSERGYSHTNFRYDYSHIDDENIKIVFSREFLANAKKAKFELPQPSVNIIYDSAE